MIKQYNDMEDRNDDSALSEIILDDNGCYDEAQAQAELSEWMKTPQAQLVGFTSQQLNDEIFRRMFEPFDKSLEKLKDMLDSINANNSRPF